MVEEIRKIKISQIDKEISELKNEKSKYNWLEKNIIKRKQYAEEEQRKKQKIKELTEKREKYEQIQQIQGFGLTLESAMKLLEDYSILPTLKESDIQINSWHTTKPDVDELDGIILVHKTNHAPIGSRIKSTKEAEVFVDTIKTIAGKKIETKVQNSRNTVHFCVNGEVSSHFHGDWEDRKYAVLIPIKDIPLDTIGSLNAADTYTVGGVNLTNNTWIVVPKGEKKNIQQNNPNVNIIEYDGKNVTRYAEQVIKMLGYHPKKIDKFSFRNDNKSQEKFDTLREKLGKTGEAHYYSIHNYNENFETYMQVIVQMIKYVEENNDLLDDKQFLNDLTSTLETHINLACRSTKNITQTIIDFYNYLLSSGFVIPEENIKQKCEICTTYKHIAPYMTEEVIKLLKNIKQTEKQKEK